MKQKHNIRQAFFAVAALFVCGIISFAIPAQETKRVLFIGNSYTHVNDLPSVLTDVAASQNQRLECQMHAPGGARFFNHLFNSEVLNLIRHGDWDFIVLQGQSQEVAFPDGQFFSEVYPDAKGLDSLAKTYNPDARVLFYMTWGYRYGDPTNCPYYPPFCTFETMGERLKTNYTLMASDFRSDVAPVGAAWLNSWRQDSTVVLHSSDNSHPNINGTYLAACCFYDIMFKTPLMNACHPASVDASTAQYLQTLANNVVIDSLSSWCFTQEDSFSETLSENATFDFSVQTSPNKLTIFTKDLSGKADLEIVSSDGKRLLRSSKTLTRDENFTLDLPDCKGVILIRLTKDAQSLTRKVVMM